LVLSIHRKPRLPCRHTSDGGRKPSVRARLIQKFTYRKEVETVMPANEDAAGSGSLYCFVTETIKKVTL
jgi:hypothetical protein